MRYNLVRPCLHCPFRTDIDGYLHPERCVEIGRSLANGATFPCHKTTVTDPDDESQNTATAESQFCAGALIMLEKQEAPNQAMRIAERLGVYDAQRLDMSAPVVGSVVELERHHRGEDEEERECCGISNHGCNAPAGYLEGGVVIPGEGEASYECEGCGESVCDSEDCGDGKLCAYCQEVE